MTVIWGLDLKEMQWAKFKSSYMFKNREYYLRRTKFGVYQGAMIFCVVSESLGTAVLSDYVSQQRRIQGRFPGIDLFNNDYIGIASYNIFIGICIATVFGAAFFFDLFWPLRYEPRSIQWAWQGCAIFLCIAGLADALAYTIILTLRGERVNGVENLTQQQTVELVQELGIESSQTPLLYRSSGRAVASVVLLWIGWLFTVMRYVAAVAYCGRTLTQTSTLVMIKFYAYVRRTGSAKSPHALQESKEAIIESEGKASGS